jgi:hypothetical protein
MMSGAWSVVTFTFCKKSPPPPVLTKLTTVPLTMPPLANAPPSPSGAVAVLAPTIAAGFSAETPRAMPGATSTTPRICH